MNQVQIARDVVMSPLPSARPVPFHAEAQDRGRTVELILSGDLSFDSDGPLTREFEALDLTRRPHMIVRMERVPYANSAGIAVLLAVLIDAKAETDGILILGLNADLERIFRRIGIDRLISMPG